MSMQYCASCDKMIDTDYNEFYNDCVCLKCHLKENLTKSQEDLILARENE